MKTTAWHSIISPAIGSAVSVLLLLCPAIGSAETVASDGSDGPFHPTNSMTLTLPEDGLFNFTTIIIPEGVTIRFVKNEANTPVFLAATQDVVIAGKIDVSAPGTSQSPGPGGFAGGQRGNGAGNPGTAGGGPGGGEGGPGNGSAGGGAGNATPGYRATKSSGGPTPADGGPAVSLAEPFAGGNGGGGGGGQSLFGVPLDGGPGGGGGGAVWIATPGHCTISGTIVANGGNGVWGFANIFAHGGPGGAGSGGNALITAAGGITVTPAARFTLRGGYGGGLSTQPYDFDPPGFSCGANGGIGYVRFETDGLLVLPPITGGNIAVFDCSPSSGDISGDCVVDLEDAALLAQQWTAVDCGLCNGADLTGDGNVNVNDLLRFTDTWMLGLK